MFVGAGWLDWNGVECDDDGGAVLGTYLTSSKIFDVFFSLYADILLISTDSFVDITSHARSMNGMSGKTWSGVENTTHPYLSF